MVMPMSIKAAPSAALDPQQRYSVSETALYLRISRASLFKDIKAGALKSIKERKRRFVPGSEIVRRSQIAL
jgi:hypothetical protein